MTQANSEGKGRSTVYMCMCVGGFTQLSWKLVTAEAPSQFMKVEQSVSKFHHSQQTRTKLRQINLSAAGKLLRFREEVTRATNIRGNS